MGPATLVLSGRFKVLSHIGGGGMSEVYLAEQVSLGRKVALKVLKRDLGRRPDMAERFKREARLLSTVDHPAVVRVIDFEPSAEATILVLELAEGDTLERVLKAGPMPVERALPVLAQIAEGLAAIHDKGIVHRDIKPQNVVLTPTARGEQARLLDFGIARLMEIQEGEGPDVGGAPGLATQKDNPFISMPGQVVGTPAFVAPEQATGKPIDARTDVYSFGVLAFRVLSGLFPFPGPTSNDFLKQHISVAPRPLDDAAPQLKSQPELVALMMQCLEKNPEARPASMHLMYETLMRMMQASPFDSAVTTPSRRVLAPVSATPLPPTPLPAEPPPPVLSTPALDHNLPAESVLLAPATVEDMPAVSVRAPSAKVHLNRLRSGLQRLPHLASRVSPEWRRSLVIVGVLLLSAPAVWAMLPPTNAQRAEHLIRAGRLNEAVSLLDARLETATWEAPVLLSLKAAALHRQDRADAERELLRSHTYQALHAAHPLLLDALADDFGLSEDDRELVALLQVVPPMFLKPHFEALARGPGSLRQWGALRWLDVANEHDGIDRVDRYAAALSARECFIRVGAGRRLAELGSTDAIPRLRLLSETPKDEGPDGQLDCGQDQAAESIRKLKKAAQ